MTSTIGSGLGGFTAIVAQPVYGAAFIPPTRAPSFKSNKATHNPHIVDGGPYLRDGVSIVGLGSAHVQTWLDATGVMQGDMTNTGEALLLAAAFGSAGTLTQSGTTTAYQLGGAGGISLGDPAKNNNQFDMQIASPDDDGLLHQFNYPSTMITKAEWVFDRSGLVTKSYTWDAQTVQEVAALVVVTEPGGPVPFSMASASSTFLTGTLAGETATDGCRKATFTIDRKQAVDRIYLGATAKQQPVTNALVACTVALEFDYTDQARTFMETFLTNTAQSIIAKAVGGAIGASGLSDTFSLRATSAYIKTGGEAHLDGPDIVKNTVTLDALNDTAGDAAMQATLTSADSIF